MKYKQAKKEQFYDYNVDINNVLFIKFGDSRLLKSHFLFPAVFRELLHI